MYNLLMPSTSNEDINVSDLLAEQKRRIKGLEIQKVKFNKNLAKLKLQIKNCNAGRALGV